MHHNGYRVDNVAESLDRLKERGARVTANPQPGEAFDEELIAFAYLGSDLSVKLVDTDKRRNLVG